MMMLAVMYGMMPSAKIEKLPNAPPENRSRKPSAPCDSTPFLNCFDRVGVDARNPDGDAEPVQGDHHHDEQNLVPQIGDLEDVLQVRQHSDSLVGSAVVVVRISGW